MWWHWAGGPFQRQTEYSQAVSSLMMQQSMYCIFYCRQNAVSLWHTGCPRSNVPDFGRVFLMLRYTDITQNTYVQSWTVTEIMAREKCVVFWRVHALYLSADNLIHVRPWVRCHITAIQLMLALNCLCTSFLVIRQYTSVLGIHVMYNAWNPKDNYDMSASVFVVQFNGFMSLTS